MRTSETTAFNRLALEERQARLAVEA